jgi:V/A-type H+-transporting ATPase subunit K
LNSKAIFLAGAAAIFVLTLLQNPVHAQATSPNEVISSTSAKFIAAGVVFALAAVGAGYGVGHAGAAAMAALAERPEVRSMALIITALAEAIAIYGLVMAIIILGTAST